MQARGRRAPAVIVAVLAALHGPAATASAVVSGSASRAAVVDETGVVVWNAETNSETLIDKVTFRSGGQSPFLYIVPTPVEPSVSAVPGDPARLLNRAYRSVTRHADITGVRFTSGLAWMGRRLHPSPLPKQRPATGTISNPASVNAQCRYTVLAPRDTRSFAGWLREEGFEAGPDVQDWLRPYLDRGWMLTVFRIAPRGNGQAVVRPLAFSLTFRAYKPYFPYHQPQRPGSTDVTETSSQAAGSPGSGTADGGAVNTQRTRVYVLSNARMDAVGLGRTQRWTGMTRWAAPLPEAAARELSETGKAELGIDRDQISALTWVNAFDGDGSAAARSFDLLFFSSAAQAPQSAVITIRTDRRVPIPADLVAVLAAGVLAVAARRRRGVERLEDRRPRPVKGERGAAQSIPPRRSGPADLVAPWNGQPAAEAALPNRDHIIPMLASPAPPDAAHGDTPAASVIPQIEIPGSSLQMPSAFTVASLPNVDTQDATARQEDGAEPYSRSPWPVSDPPVRSRFKRRRKVDAPPDCPTRQTE